MHRYTAHCAHLAVHHYRAVHVVVALVRCVPPHRQGTAVRNPVTQIAAHFGFRPSVPYSPFDLGILRNYVRIHNREIQPAIFCNRRDLVAVSVGRQRWSRRTETRISISGSSMTFAADHFSTTSIPPTSGKGIRNENSIGPDKRRCGLVLCFGCALRHINQQPQAVLKLLPILCGDTIQVLFTCDRIRYNPTATEASFNSYHYGHRGRHRLPTDSELPSRRT